MNHWPSGCVACSTSAPTLHECPAQRPFLEPEPEPVGTSGMLGESSLKISEESFPVCRMAGCRSIFPKSKIGPMSSHATCVTGLISFWRLAQETRLGLSRPGPVQKRYGTSSATCQSSLPRAGAAIGMTSNGLWMMFFRPLHPLSAPFLSAQACWASFRSWCCQACQRLWISTVRASWK